VPGHREGPARILAPVEEQYQLLDLNKVIEDTLFLVTKQALFFNIKLVQNLAPELPRVLADGSQCQQVFMNILMNAVQAMDERGTINHRDA